MPQPTIPIGRRPVLSRRAFLIGITLAVVVAAVLRFNGLSRRDVWLDESCTFYTAHYLFDWPADGPDRVREVAHAPYFAVLHLWTRVFGETASGMRSFSAVCGCLTVGVIGLVGSSLGGRRTGVIAAALMAVHPLHIYYSQEARVYALWMLWALVVLWALHKAAAGSRRIWWLAYALSACGLVAIHYYSLLWLPAGIAVILVAANRRRALKQWLVTHVLMALALAPIVVLVILPYARGGPKPWLAETWAGYPPALAIPRTLWALLPAGGYPDYLGPLHVAPQVLAVGLGRIGATVISFAPGAIFAMLLIGFVCQGFASASVSDADRPRGRAPRSRNAAAGFLLGSVAIYLLVAWAAAWYAGGGYVVGRYDVIALPAVVLGVAMLIASISTWEFVRPAFRGVLIWTVTGALWGSGLATALASASVPVKREQADRARWIAELVHKGDLLVSVNQYRWFMVFEWHRLGFEPSVISYPPNHDRQMCWQNAEAELADPEQLRKAANLVAMRVQRELANGRKVWLLAHGDTLGARMKVDMIFFQRLHAARIDIRPVDDRLGLAELLLPPR